MLGSRTSLLLPLVALAAGCTPEEPPEAVCGDLRGLYVGEACEELAPGVEPYEPAYPAWFDGAAVERLVYLPPGATIDTSDPDLWVFPVGARFYQNLSVGGARLETRMIEKVEEGAGRERWRFASYVWEPGLEGPREASADGARDVLGTEHDVPSRIACTNCHGTPATDVVAGFSAIQLSHDGPGWTLRRLDDEGRLSVPIPPEDATVPGDGTVRAALGYLHANCGHCHGGPDPESDQDLTVAVGLARPEEAGAYRTAVDVEGMWTTAGAVRRVAPGDPEASTLFRRVGVRDRGYTQMPPLGTERVDEAGLATLRRWIEAL